MVSTSNERDSLIRLREGDEQAFALIYNTYKNALGHRLLRLLKSEALAEEVLQDLFLKVWEQRTSIDVDKSFKSYLYRIAENMVYDVFRRAKKEKEILGKIIAANTELYTYVEEAIFRKEHVGLLEQVLDQLPIKRKKIFMACKLEGKSYKEAAEEFGISTTTVNDHIQKATQYLKSKIHTIQSVQLAVILSYIFSGK